ncbi:MAG TPA: DUF1289 domain-containing protein [Verrucomicrobiae bacterium]|nr:DUF1289 domain-containing protein [Verrucomicrobiae bacterium]
MNISSPCVNICQLDSQDVCIGCFRTRDEIARWTQMTDDEKSLVLAAVKNRRDIGSSETISCYIRPE